MRINFIKFTWQRLQLGVQVAQYPLPSFLPTVHILSPSFSQAVVFHLLQHVSLWNFRVDIVCLK